MRNARWLVISFGVLFWIVGAACDGVIGDAATSSSQEPPAFERPVAGVPADLTAAPLRRLTPRELRATIADLVDVGVDLRGHVSAAPVVFAEAEEEPLVSISLIEAYEQIASGVAAEALSTPERRSALYGCEPGADGDAACARTFIERFAPRALRRPVTDEEASALLALHGEVAAREGFDAGAEAIISALLQHPELLTLIEIGAPSADDPDLLVLGDWEIASRLSYFILGTMPPAWLFDLAREGGLSDGEARRSAARRLVNDPRAREQVDLFHARWLGYEVLPHDASLVESMRSETRHLVERVIFDEERSWLDLFTFESTHVDSTLAEHYGLPAPGSGDAGWVPYGESGRAGLLSHGSYLGVEGKFADTSPVQRGKAVMERLLCITIPEPVFDEDQMVDVDAPPPGDGCKVDTYEMHRSGECATCHSMMDPVGFGLEAYDPMGRFRTHEPGRPECAIDGEGTLPNHGAFNGPAELGRALAADETFPQCAVRQLYRFAVGRFDVRAELPALTALAEEFVGSGHVFAELMVELAASDIFIQRRREGTNDE